MARTRKRIRYFDLEKIERETDTPLSPTEQEVQRHLAHDPWAALALRTQLEEALQSLTPLQRQCVELLRDGASYREIARTLQISLPKVQRVLAAVRKAFKKALREEAS